MKHRDRIKFDLNLRGGKPVISGTRVPVDLIIGKLASGMTFDEIISEYEITKEDILAALDYAADSISSEEIRSVI